MANLRHFAVRNDKECYVYREDPTKQFFAAHGVRKPALPDNEIICLVSLYNDDGIEYIEYPYEIEMGVFEEIYIQDYV